MTTRPASAVRHHLCVIVHITPHHPHHNNTTLLFGCTPHNRIIVYHIFQYAVHPMQLPIKHIPLFGDAAHFIC